MGPGRRRGIGVRGWLGLAAVAALVLGAEGGRRRRSYCLERASYHRMMIASNRGALSFLPMAPDLEDQLARSDDHAAWHLGLARQFARVAARPWESPPVEPEEPGGMWLHHVVGGFDAR